MTVGVVQIFESHTKLDVATCDMFDTVVARVGIKAFRSEYEEMKPPAWETIKNKIKLSKALFLLVGEELVKAQAQRSDDWKFTQNWIAYEVGLACAMEIDVWVVCNGTYINFPVPYLNNYVIGTIKINSKFYRKILQNYCDGQSFPFGYDNSRTVTCPNFGCGAKFNFHTQEDKDDEIICPTCLNLIPFPEGFPYEK